MVSAKIKKTVLVTAIALMGFTSVAQGASMSKRMNEMFNSLSNTTKPGAFETSSRGVISAGGLVVRNQISSVNFASMQAPSIEAGCGGIDFFGGSFSFISADQLVEFLKNVASNAIGYAFKMALKQVCEPCVNILNDLQNLANAVNSMNANSCQLAQGIVDTGFKLLDRDAKNEVDLKATVKGLVDDVASAFNKTSGKSGAQAAKEDSTKTVQKDFDVNFAYEAGKKAGAAAIFPSSSAIVGGDTEKGKLEFLMSLTGTVVKKIPDESAADTAMPMVAPFRPTLSFQDFVEGTYGTGSAGDNKVVSVYTCLNNDSEDKCLEPKAQKTDSYEGLRKLLVDKLTEAGGDGNLAYLYRNASGDLTEAQKNIVSFVGPKVATYIRNLAQVDEGTAMQFIIEAAPIIAAQVAFENGKRLFDEVQTSMRALDKKYDSKEAQKIMAESRAKFNNEFRTYIQNNGGIYKLTEIYNALMELTQSSKALRNDQGLGKK